MVENSLVSVIIPVYKVEAHLSYCVKSVLEQNYQDIEILLIDDGSPDNCPQLCDDLAKTDNRIKVIHQQNKGLSGARNTGLRYATGGWIYFLDSDDSIIPECIEYMLGCAKSYPRAQIVIAGAQPSAPGFEWMDIASKQLPEYSEDRNWICKSFLTRTLFSMTAWNKLVKRDFLLENNLYFEEGVINEDDIWNFHLAKHVDAIAICKKNTYKYLIRPGSIVNTIADRNKQAIILLRHFVTHVTDPFRNYQITFIYCFLKRHLFHPVPESYKEDYTYIVNNLISEARGLQKISLLIYFKAPFKLSHDYHVFGRIMSHIGTI